MQSHRGFTIVELLIVIVVIAVLAAITTVAYNGIRERSNNSASVSYLTQVKKQLLSHREVNGGNFPLELSELGGQNIAAPMGAEVWYSSRNNVSPSVFSLILLNNGKYYTTSATTDNSIPHETGLFSEQFFNNRELSGAAVVSSSVQSVNYAWAQASPRQGVTVDNFSVRWNTVLTIPQDGTYTFYATSDDGQRLYVDGFLLINDWIPHAQTTRTATISLKAGQKVAIQYEFFDASYDAIARLEWATPSSGRAVLNAN